MVGEKQEVGKIEHYYGNINVAVVELKGDLKVGDTICVEGHGNVLTQKVASMQIEHKTIPLAKKGQSIGMKMDGRVKEGDIVYKVLT